MTTFDADAPAPPGTVPPQGSGAGPPSAGYRADIDGLRGLAVAAVVLFHLGIPGFASGWVGVDVFFVISGYVITTTCLRDFADGRFSIIGFYERRVRRILPAFLCLLAVVLAAASVIQLPFLLRRTADAALGGLGLFANVVLWRQDSYFSPTTQVQPLLHIWTLSVEEQFYLLFPAALALIWPRSRRAFRLLLAAGILVSFAAYLVVSHFHSDATQYLAPFRAWELGLGGLVALPRRRQLPTALARTAPGLGLLLVLLAIALPTVPIHAQQLSVLVACLGATALVAVRVERGVVDRLLSSRPAVFLGLISYSLYLWHWPLFSFAHQLSPAGLTVAAKLLLLAAALLLAVLSWRFVEQPFRRPGGVLNRRRLIAASALAVAVAVLAGCALAIRLTDGWSGRYPPQVAAMARFLDYGHSGEQAKLARGGCLSVKPDAIDFDQASCLSDAPGRRTILLWGDSHAEDLAEPLAAVSASLGAHFNQATKSSCRPPSLPWAAPAACQKFIQMVQANIRRTRPAIVILSANWTPNNPLLAGAIQAITSQGSRVILVGPAPEYPLPLAILLIRYHLHGDRPSLDPAGLSRPQALARDRTIRAQFAGLPGVTYVSLIDAICPGGRCQTMASGEPVEWDNSHFTLEGARLAVSLALKAPLARVYAETAPGKP